MDVVCGRCRAEYEFDDALISERGTTVRCTNCGLQFKVFPPAGVRPPEVWSVFDPDDLDAAPLEYDSLRALQKSIVRGDVRSHFLLSRGDEKPRPLGEIVELQPLLSQPISQPPPPFDSISGAQEEIVPSSPPEPIDDGRSNDSGSPPSGVPVSVDGRPRIRSALSPGPGFEGRTTPVPPSPARVSESGSLAPPRVSLRSTLSSSALSSTASASVRPVAVAPVPPPVEEKASRTSSFPPDAEGTFEAMGDSAESAPGATHGAVDGDEVDERESSPSVPPASDPPESAPAYERTSSMVSAPVNPRIFDSAYAGQATPTPAPMRAYQTADADPQSAMAARPVARQARSGAIVLAVFVGVGAFLLFANRDRLSEALEPSTQATVEAAALGDLSPTTLVRLAQVDERWILEHLLGADEATVAKIPPPSKKELEEALAKSGRANSWYQVNLLRARGALAEARAMAGELSLGAEAGYALSLLDLAENPADPPWPVILERLREASIGEGAPFLAKTAYVHALFAAGETARARAEYHAFGQLPGANASVLYEALGATLPEPGEDTAEDAAGSPQPSGAMAPLATPDETEKAPSPIVEPAPKVDSEKSPKQKSEPQPASEDVPSAPSEPKPRAISPEVEQKVNQADALWRGGDRDGALTLYRQVVAAIGTGHFLGQRSAARIRQAEREKAESP